MSRVVKNNFAPIEWGKNAIEADFYQSISISFFKMLVCYVIIIGVFLASVFSFGFYVNYKLGKVRKIEGKNEHLMASLSAEIDTLKTIKKYETMRVDPPIIVQYGVIAKIALTNRLLIGNLKYYVEPDNNLKDICAEDFMLKIGKEISVARFDGFWQIDMLTLSSDNRRMDIQNEIDKTLAKMENETKYKGYAYYIPHSISKESTLYIGFLSKSIRE